MRLRLHLLCGGVKANKTKCGRDNERTDAFHGMLVGLLGGFGQPIRGVDNLVREMVAQLPNSYRQAARRVVGVAVGEPTITTNLRAGCNRFV